MRLTPLRHLAALAAGAAVLLVWPALASIPASAAPPGPAVQGQRADGVRHVLLLSVDGLHQ